MPPRYTVALCQMDTQTDRDANLATASRLLAEAAGRGARLVAFPEVFNVIDRGEAPPEDIPGGATVTHMATLAREYGVWVLCGSLHQQSPEGGKPRNTSVLLSPRGRIVATYSKLHMFDITLPDGTPVRESDIIQPGSAPVVADTPLGRLGLSVCYDLRFPELYRLLTLQGAQVLCIPAEFNRDTGALHWKALLQARAIENGCYVLAPAQTGVKQTRDGPYPCYGHSMILDPLGRVLACLPEGEGIALAELDLSLVEETRQKIPSLKNRRRDIYTINGL